MPRFRRIISASAKLPLASFSALLHSIIPAPVRSRSSFTSFALISMVVLKVVLNPFSCCWWKGKPWSLASPELKLLASPYVAAHLFRGFLSGPLARQRHGRQVLVGNALRHELIELLRIELRVLEVFLGRRLVGDDFFGAEVVLGRQSPAFDNR